MKEVYIERLLVTSVEKMGGMCVKFPAVFYAGFPDRLIFLPGGLLVLVEIKASGKKPRLLQQKVHTKLRGLGFRVEVLDTIQAVEAFILTI